MKKITLLLSILVIASVVFSQQWHEKLPQKKSQNSDYTFYEIQKAFNDYWDPLNVQNGYYKNDEGVDVKAPGWKQFKRWEWYWENRIIKETGEFPKTSAIEELIKTESANPSNKSPNGNWTSLGPNSTSGGYAGLGRLNCVSFISGDANTIYVGSASGGLWKTADGGTSWIPLGDNNAVLGVSDIISYRIGAGPDVIYIATGDKDGGSMWSLGGGQYNDNNSVGVLKSVDGGATWNTTGLSFTPSQLQVINRLLLHPSDNNILYAATSAGVFKTINAGTVWNLISANVFKDMEFKPGTPSTIYGSNSSGDIFLSVNDGATWTQSLTTSNSRTELAVSSNNSNLVYAVSANSAGGLAGIYKSTDSGASFTQVFSGSTSNMLNWDCNSTDPGGQGSYDLCIAADPNNANNVFVGGVNTWKSTNGGSAWSITNVWTSSYGCGVSEVHADQHYLAYQNGTSTLFECNDGGLYKTVNNGSTWTHHGNGLVISQIYRLGVAQTVANENIVGLQDNGTKAFLSGVWSDEIGGDGFECAIDYTNANTLYGELYYGEIRRSTNHGTSWSAITSGLTTGSGNSHWCTPFVLDPNVNTTLYLGARDVYKTTNQGNSWSKISTWAGSTLKSLAVAPSNSLYIYAATSSILYRTTIGGTTWTNITGTLPVGSGDITYISVKNDDPNTVWVSLGGYNATRIYQTIDGGATWTNISAGLPSIPVMCVIQNKQNTSQVELYAGTDVGVYVKVGSANWTMFSTGLPNVVVTELEIYYDANPDNSRLRAATYGRGLWQSDLFSSATAPPVANFVANNTTPAIGTQVNFTDLSSNTPTSWSWSFSPTSVSYLNGTTSTSQNPQVQFPDPGLYEVTLTATNAFGSDAETKSNYINVINCNNNPLPFTENFSGIIIPTCWTQIDNQGNGQVWEFGTITNQTPNPILNGNYAYLNSDDYGSGNSQNADLISPTFDLSSYSNVSLQFNHSFLQWAGSSGKVSYSINNGSSWNDLQSFTTTTANPATFNQVISAIAGQSQVKFKWNYTGTWGYYWAIDNIQITGTFGGSFPTAFNFTGGGSYCQNTTPTGINATLSNSELDASYQLMQNSIALGIPVNGTGSALIWNNLVAGSYTVVATNITGNSNMNGTVTVIENLLQPSLVSIAASENPVGEGGVVSFNATPINGGAMPVYQWFVNDVTVGTNTESYAYIPQNADQVKVVMTSSLACTSGSPATSNVVTMVVTSIDTQAEPILRHLCFPNPFKETAIISYDLPQSGKVRIVLYNDIGQKFKVLVDEVQSTGEYRISLNKADLSAAGSYFYRIELVTETKTLSARGSILMLN